MEGSNIEELKDRLHRKYLDPLWQSAAVHYSHELEQRPWLRSAVVKRARERVYEWLAFKLLRPDAHIRNLDRDDCLEAMKLLSSVDYKTIRTWAVNKDRRRKRLRKVERSTVASTGEK